MTEARTLKTGMILNDHGHLGEITEPITTTPTGSLRIRVELAPDRTPMTYYLNPDAKVVVDKSSDARMAFA